VQTADEAAFSQPDISRMLPCPPEIAGLLPRPKGIRRGTFASVQALIRTIRAYIASWNTDPRPFQWTAITDEILAKVRLTQINIKKLVANNSK